MKNKKSTAIVQARMGSTRLPGKVLLQLHDKTVLGHVLTRLKQSKYIDQIIVATTDLDQDQCIVDEAGRYEVNTFRGSEKDVLSRYYEAARQFDADPIVRITADCPIIDPNVTDQVILQYFLQSADYASNTLKRTFPRGLDTEVFSRKLLREAYEKGLDAVQREHVTPYILQHPNLFKLVSYEIESIYSKYRWTLDTKEDWVLIQKIYDHLYSKNHLFSWLDVIKLMEKHPELVKINEHVEQKKWNTAE